MSDNILTIRKVYNLDGSITHLYRINTRDWVEIEELDLSEYYERSDGDYVRQNPIVMLLNKDDV